MKYIIQHAVDDLMQEYQKICAESGYQEHENIDSGINENICMS